MRRFATLAASALLFTAGSAIFAPAANAATVSPNDDSRCPANSICLFQNINYGGTRAVFSGRGYVLCDFTQISFNNEASSMINNTGEYIALYEFVGCNPNGGVIYTLKPHSVDSTFVNNNFNDKASGINIP